MVRNPHPEVTERRILAAAKKLFAEKGYDKTSIQDIIDKLGDLSRGAIYHHFKSKEAILERLNTDDWHASQALCDELAKRDDMNAMEKLRSLFANSLGDAAHLALVKATVPFFDDPATFTAIVPKGKAITVQDCTIFDTQYLMPPPKKLPMLTINISFISLYNKKPHKRIF